MARFGFMFFLLVTSTSGFVIEGVVVEVQDGTCLGQKSCSECLSSEGKQEECIFAQIGRNDHLICLPSTQKEGTRAFLENESDCETLKDYPSIKAMKTAVTTTSKQRRDAEENVEEDTFMSTSSTLPSSTLLTTIQQLPTTTPMTDTEGSEQTFSAFVEPEPTTTVSPSSPEELEVKQAQAPEVQLFTWTVPDLYACDDNIDWMRTNLERSFCRTMVYYNKVGREHLSHTLLANYYTNPSSGRMGHCDYLFWMRKNCKVN